MSHSAIAPSPSCTGRVTERLREAWKNAPKGAQQAVKAASVISTVALLPWAAGIPLAGALAYKLFDNARIVLPSERTLPGTGESTGATSTSSTNALAARISDFVSRKPLDVNWVPPPPAQQPNPPQVVSLNLHPLFAEPVLGANPREEQINYLEKTNSNVKTLAINSSHFVSASFLLVTCLQLPFHQNLILEVVRRASPNEAQSQPSLWNAFQTAYAQHVGSPMNWHQKLRAKIGLLLVHSSGLFPNAVDTFFTQILSEIRVKLNGHDRKQKMAQFFDKTLSHASNFLAQYNGAMKAFAERAPSTGDAETHRSGVVKQLYGGQDQVCAQLSNSLLKHFFPKLPFFEGLSQSPLTSWIYYPLDFCIGRPLNWLAKKITQRILPPALGSIITSTTNAANPTNIPFSKAVMKSLADLFLRLKNKPITNVAAPQDSRNTPLPLVVKELLKTIHLLSGGSDQQDSIAMKKKFAEIESQFTHLHIISQIQKGIVGGVQSFFHQLENDKEATEKLLGDVFHLFNIAFREPPKEQSSAPPVRVAQPPQEIQSDPLRSDRENLALHANGFFDRVIGAGALQFFRGSANAETSLAESFEAYQINSTDIFKEVEKVVQEMQSQLADLSPNFPSIYSQLDQLAQILKYFTTITEMLDASIGSEAHKTAIQCAYRSVYEGALKQGQFLLDAQDLLTQRDNHARMRNTYHQISQLCNTEANVDFSIYRGKIDAIRAMIKKSKETMPKQAENLPHLEQMIESQAIFKIARDEQEILLQPLMGQIDCGEKADGVVRGVERILTDVLELKNFIAKSPTPGLNRRTIVRQITQNLTSLPIAEEQKSQVQRAIQTLQAAENQSPQPNLDTLHQEILELLQSIAGPHRESLVAARREIQHTFDAMRDLCAANSELHKAERDKFLDSLTKKMSEWKEGNSQTIASIESAQLETQYRPLSHLPQTAIDFFTSFPLYKPWNIKDQVLNTFKEGVKVTTSPDFLLFGGLTAMHQFAENYK